MRACNVAKLIRNISKVNQISRVQERQLFQIGPDLSHHCRGDARGALYPDIDI